MFSHKKLTAQINSILSIKEPQILKEYNYQILISFSFKSTDQTETISKNKISKIKLLSNFKKCLQFNKDCVHLFSHTFSIMTIFS